MGRHSAPDDDAGDGDVNDGNLLHATEPAESASVGRHARPSTPEPATAPRGHSSAADLALVRGHGDVRARCLAGLLAPFVIYAVVLLAAGASGRQWALWIFAPLVLAGVLVGTFLDAGHKHYPAG